MLEFAQHFGTVVYAYISIVIILIVILAILIGQEVKRKRNETIFSIFDDFNNEIICFNKYSYGNLMRFYGVKTEDFITQNDPILTTIDGNKVKMSKIFGKKYKIIVRALNEYDTIIPPVSYYIYDHKKNFLNCISFI